MGWTRFWRSGFRYVGEKKDHMLHSEQVFGNALVKLQTYKVQVNRWKDSESDYFDKINMKEKVNDSVRLHKAMEEKLETVSYSEQIQIHNLVPDKWYVLFRIF